MSKIQVNEIVNHFDTGAPDCPKGLTVTGFTTYTGGASFSGDVSIGGTLTYEDVTNIDSVGVITARNGIEVTGGNVHIAGAGSTIGVGTAYIGSIEVTGGNVHIAGVGATLGVTTAYISSINDLGYPSAGPLSNRNMVINGAMQVAQRGNTVSSINSGTGYYTADRFRLDVSMGTWTSDRMTNSQGDTYESGSTERFRNSLRLTCTAGQASPGATDNVKIVYFIEGQDVQHLDYGTSNAKTMTLSFWVRSTKTGTDWLQ
ncbi:putative carbohydrate binding domain containing protein [Synechococcus phage S-B43]|nr:putative carbohydrate binding domain containing protein [Synechococcus phage S-B43]